MPVPAVIESTLNAFIVTPVVAAVVPTNLHPFHIPPVVLPGVISILAPDASTAAAPPAYVICNALTPAVVTGKPLVDNATISVVCAALANKLTELAAAILNVLLPLAVNVPVEVNPVVPMLPTLALPVPVFNVPATLTPVPVTTNTLAVPIADMLTFPLAAGILTFELPFACTPNKFPPVMLPVVVIALDPAAMIPMILPPEMLPVVVIVLLPAAIIPMILPPEMLPVVVIVLLPAAIIPIILPPVMLPVPVFNVPVMLAPVPVTTRVVLPADTMFTLPLTAGMLTLLVPFDTVAVTPVNAAPLPTNPVAVIYPFAKLTEKLAFDCRG